MNIATAVTVDGLTATGLGRAHWVGVAEVTGPRVTAWAIHEVGWDDASLFSRPSRHNRIVRFLVEQEIRAVVVPRLGRHLAEAIDALGITVLPASPGDARESILAAVATQPGSEPESEEHSA